jgi:hypothetical protein
MVSKKSASLHFARNQNLDIADNFVCMLSLQLHTDIETNQFLLLRAKETFTLENCFNLL